MKDPPQNLPCSSLLSSLCLLPITFPFPCQQRASSSTSLLPKQQAQTSGLQMSRAQGFNPALIMPLHQKRAFIVMTMLQFFNFKPLTIFFFFFVLLSSQRQSELLLVWLSEPG